MFNVSISNEFRVNVMGGSKGTQVKYLYDGFWYKEDNLGNEGMVEYIVSLILKNSTLPECEYVLYEQGIINGKLGCRSRDFTEYANGTFHTLKNLYIKFTGRNLDEEVMKISGFEARRDFVLEFFKKYYDHDLTNYFSKVFTLDLLTLNSDRHFNNLGVIITSGGLVVDAPLFDNGMSLLNGNYSVRPALGVEYNSTRVTSKPFSGSPERQYKLFNHSFFINYDNLLEDLCEIEDSFQKELLVFQLEKYRTKFNSKFSGTSLF